ncbi:MAG: iron transporter FeoB [Anaerolineaceae bacterium 4572_78]|nr:MAG: iron transporter FeoB [Anaerolineaceae bacterium 4572_78]
MMNKTDDILRKASKLHEQIDDEFHDQLAESLYADATRIADRAVSYTGEKPRFDFDRSLDRIVTSRIWGFPLMLLLFTLVFWLTVEGANYPSAMLAFVFIDTIHPVLHSWANTIGMTWWVSGLLIDGLYLATAWVISVMLPPMAIFFPMFTLLEDFGYLPRVAFNLDNIFKKAGAHGKQSLSMMMGFGCNAAGIIATRIIDSPRERLIAIITNNFALCNGRWPTQILIATLFIGALVPPFWAGIISALSVVGIALFGIVLSLLVSWGLSNSILKGEASTFSLELPSYRPPRFWQTIYTSLIDRTLIVLWRAIVFAAPAGMVIWLIANITIGEISIAEYMVHFLNPIGWLIGLNGVILVAYIVAIPANEIIIPTVLMLMVLTVKNAGGMGSGAGVMFEGSENEMMTMFSMGDWTLLTAVNLMLFSLLHNPCSTAIYTIYKETGSIKWTAISTFLPIIMGFVICFMVAFIWRLVA